MKKVFVSLFLIFVCAFLIVAIPSFNQKATQILSYSRCDKPTQYKIGSIDSRFGLNQSEALSNIRQAANVWDNADARNLFTYADNADLTINFVYDKRQALRNQINQLNTSLSQKNTILQQQIDEYNVQVASFEKRLNEFNAKVDKYNQEGGVSPDVYNDLVKEQNDLKNEADMLNERAKQLNLSTQDYNADISVLDQDIYQFNTALSQKPEEGTYDEETKTITIYFVDNHQELLHTLSHEFGHALGINHVGNPSGIMYPYTTASLVLSSDDIKQLNYVCKEQSILDHWAEMSDRWLSQQFQNIQ